ncbi:protein SRC2-like [Miscanthus floridulus]|uniref:protein SRC2-like n=1 Tax=Miscanthus floridulus TaxID=154761 RepID=UPI0034584F0C
MAYQVLEVTLISAKDLKRVTLFSKMRVYAVASISGGDPRLPTHRTYADREGGRNPIWHAPLRFTIPPAADPRGLALHVLLRAERAFGDRDVGEVVVPMQDLAAASAEGSGAGASANAEQRHLSYQVRRPVSGRKRGVLHISYRLSDAPAPVPDAYHRYTHAPPASSMSSKRHHGKGADAAITAYPVATPRGGGARQYPPYHQPYGHAPYGGPAGAYPHHHQYGYGAYGYGAAPYGYGGHGAAPAGRSGGGAGMGTTAGLGLGLLGGLMIGDMIADAEVDAAYDGGFMDGMGF